MSPKVDGDNSCQFSPYATEPPLRRKNEFALWHPGSHLGAVRMNDHVDLAANAEAAGEVHAGLDREPNSGHEEPVVVGLVTVQMGAGPMQILVDRVSGAMHEEVAKPFPHNDIAGRLVEHGTGYRLPGAPAAFELIHRRIARVPHR